MRKMVPRWPQDGPEMAQDGPKMAPRGPKIAPRRLQKGSEIVVFTMVFEHFAYRADDEGN